MGNHHQYRRPSEQGVVRKYGWVEYSGRTDNEPPYDENTDDTNGGCLAGKSLTEGGDDHDHELNSV